MLLSTTFDAVHPKNPYADRYDIKSLAKYYPILKDHIILNPEGEQTIDFNSSISVFELNKAILLKDFELEDYHLPTGYLIPPIPGRLDYLLHLKEFLIEKFKNKKDSEIKGLDIGSGANGIYCLLAAQYFNWNMVGAESDKRAVVIANKNIDTTKRLKNRVDIRLQKDKSFLFKNIIQPNEQFDFSICNPPFNSSKEEALKGSLKKIRNLGGVANDADISLNFDGQANELWCNGGEALFIKRMIKESVSFKAQVKVFSSLVSKSENLPKIEKQLQKIKSQYQIINMEQGHKKSRIVLWWFD